MAAPRHAWATIDYAGKDITKQVSASLLNLTYVDKSTGEADELNITMHDIDGQWHSNWYPKAQSKNNTGQAILGTVLRAIIHVQNWFSQGDYLTLDCGAFEIDSCDLNGPPNIFNIKAVSTPLTSSMRRELKCRGWEDVTLQKIAQDVADSAKIELMYEVKRDIKIDRKDQLQESDLIFLKKVCKKYGITIKVSNDKLVLFDEKDYEQKGEVETLTAEEVKNTNNPSGRILKYHFYQDTSECVSEASVSYKDKLSGKVIKCEFTPPNPPATGQMIRINNRPGDVRGDNYRSLLDEGTTKGVMTKSKSAKNSNTIDDFDDIRPDATEAAMQEAQAQTREKNKHEWNCDITMVGNPKIVAGVTFKVVNFGVYEGKYIVEEATHTISNGYTTSIKAHKVLEGY